jgi:hypothetical protein
MLRVTDETLHSALSHVFDIGIECECGRRALLPVKQTGATGGSTTIIRDLRLVCSGCGSRTFEAFLFFRPAQCAAFARGDSYADVWGLRNAGLPPDDPRVTRWSHLQNPFREPPPPAARGVIGCVRIDTRRRLGRGSQEAPSNVPTQSVTARPLGVHQPR